MKAVPTAIPEVVLLEPRVHADARGSFWEAWRTPDLAPGVRAAFVQGNRAVSACGVLRGLHLQVATPQAKLVRVARGTVFDVAVDVRVGSPTFARWVGTTLSAENRLQCWIPEGFAHGYAVTSEEGAEVEYEVTGPYDPTGEVRIAWDDPEIGIVWPLSSPALSDKDGAAPRLSEVLPRLPPWRR